MIAWASETTPYQDSKKFLRVRPLSEVNIIESFAKFIHIDVDIVFDNYIIQGSNMYDPPPPLHPPLGHWMAAVPKGFLRYYVLRLLGEKPMSGSEIMNEIEKRTGGRWKPSPGSIYPLLSWLRGKGYTREVLRGEAGIKRYALTDKGKAFLQEYIKRREEFRRKFALLMPPFSGLFWLDFHPEKVRELFKAGENFVTAFWVFLDNLREKYSEDAIAEVKEVMEQAARKMDEIAKKMEKD